VRSASRSHGVTAFGIETTMVFDATEACQQMKDKR
jgi:hypothetical protein